MFTWNQESALSLWELKTCKNPPNFIRTLGFLYKKEMKASVFELNGTKLALYPKSLLAKDANVPENGTGFSGFTLAHNVSSKEEVEEILKKAESIGAKITDKAHERDWGGYSGYFSDPDGYLWEIAWNTYFK